MPHMIPHAGELSKATKARDINLVRRLLEQGADPHEKDYGISGSLLHYAVEFERSGDLAKLLIEHGADINAVNTQFGTTPLMYAARSNLPALVLLLSKGADISKKDMHGRTALDWAKQAGQKDAVKILKAATKQKVQETEKIRLSTLHNTAAERQKTIGTLRPKMIGPS